MSEKKAKDSHVWNQNEFHWYVEGSECTRALLRAEKFAGVIYDPCCGQGNIIKACWASGVSAYGSDIEKRTTESWFMGEHDFLGDSPFDDQCLSDPGMSIIMNPPFYRAVGTEAFIRKALTVAKHKVACFVDMKFLSGSARAKGVYAEHPPSRVWLLSPRPSCPPGEYLLAGNKAGGGTTDYCWLVWDLLSPSSETKLGWLRILPEDYQQMVTNDS
jgi:hypothetical protein